MSPARTLGLFLVLIGAALLGATFTGLGGELIVAFLGVAFLAAYVSTRAYGFLIPGAILMGLGLGIIAESAGAPGETVVLGLGLGFLAIPVVDLLTDHPRPAWWWPLIPGGILTIIGAAEMTGVDDVGRYAVPVVLIAIGVLLLLRRGPDRQPRSATTTDGGDPVVDGSSEPEVATQETHPAEPRSSDDEPAERSSAVAPD